MNGGAREQIAFDVETSRILQILSSEIYDSPNALLRENVQNAYDAILMRCTEQNLNLKDCMIKISVSADQLVVEDNGIGMTDEVLKSNFWKAGSSGKKSELAQRSGVIGTFGIGAMANFGVCTSLKVETRHIYSDVTLISSAKRDELRIAQNCIDLERLSDNRPPGTKITAHLDPSFQINESTARNYLEPYVGFLPVAVRVNDTLISQRSFEDTLANRSSGFILHSSRNVSHGQYSGMLGTSFNPQGQIMVRLTGITLSGSPVPGEMFFIQQGGQTMGFRNLFGLAPIPIASQYQFGGFVSLNILQPTAGREALSRDSIQHVANLVTMIEAEVSVDMADSPAADRNTYFQQYILSNGKIELARNVKVTVLPSREEVALSKLKEFEPNKQIHFYAGRDETTLKKFGSSEQSNLIHINQSNPKRNLQTQYIQSLLGIPQVPEKVIVERVPSTQLTMEEAMLVVRIRGVLLDDYLMPNVEVVFATISHAVTFHIEKAGDIVHICIARGIPAVTTVLECYRTARDVFGGFVKDFVREHLYPHIRDLVPSSTRDGRDVLFRRLKESKELFRYEESDLGDLESLLADYLSGKTDLGEVLRTSTSRASTQRQRVSSDQVGTVEKEMPDIIESPSVSDRHNEFEAAPPIMRLEMPSRMKVLTVGAEYEQLNKFHLFLGLSDRLFRTEGAFFRWPHTTKLIWGGHRVVYIFTDATGGLSLYYDIELKEPLDKEATSGGMFPTTTIFTENRIYVPVPNELDSAFRITKGAKEFFVRFDTIP
jgi:molecular chaperone HtpG